ncbi:MAG TPA: glycoside hydrolase family 44 protein, partial [Beijerinckiaceae bacterium]|nr:glycoside hydrolase family 44 protein [Beijerinckiaceae bacterium]
RWGGRTPAAAAPDLGVADVPHLLARLIERYGGAGSERGIHAYALDNEPGIWFQTHPRLMPRRITIRAFIERSVAAARVIKSLDPRARVFGPGSWGATEMVSFQDAPDWPEYRRQGSFLAAYLAAFRAASEDAGLRLLDVLDVHWYPFSRHGNLFRTENAALDAALLDAPRGLTEAGYREDSWVADALRVAAPDRPGLPILPSLRRLIDRRFPGTDLAITEFNYGGAGRLAAGLALADVLGRYGAANVAYATHWGSLDGWLKEAYRLFRMPDASGRRFGGRHLPVQGQTPELDVHAAADEGAVQLIAINKRTEPVAMDVAFGAGRAARLLGVLGFDALHPTTAPVTDASAGEGGRLILPGRSARRYTFA